MHLNVAMTPLKIEDKSFHNEVQVAEKKIRETQNNFFVRHTQISLYDTDKSRGKNPSLPRFGCIIGHDLLNFEVELSLHRSCTSEKTLIFFLLQIK